MLGVVHYWISDYADIAGFILHVLTPHAKTNIFFFSQLLSNTSDLYSHHLLFTSINKISKAVLFLLCTFNHTQRNVSCVMFSVWCYFCLLPSRPLTSLICQTNQPNHCQAKTGRISHFRKITIIGFSFMFFCFFLNCQLVTHFNMFSTCYTSSVGVEFVFCLSSHEWMEEI